MTDTTATTGGPPPTEAKTEAPLKSPEIKRSWGDEADDEPEDSAAPSNARDDVVSELNVESLKINEPKLLDDPEDSNIRAVTTGDTPYTSAMRFEDLNLSEELLKGLYVEMRFERPSKIQAVTLPMILTPPYKNLIAQAHNGSGKTTCFVLGMLSRVDPKLQAPQALCICPTRELAIQNLEVLTKMGKHTGITAERAVPESLEKVASTHITKRPPVTAQVIIGTPGTIKKWISYKKLSLIFMKILVFDEADHMLAEDGFRDDSLRIMNEIKRSNTKCQVLLFSATFNDTVKNFVTRTIQDYNQLFVKKEELSLESVKQYKVNCPDELAKNLVIKDKILELGDKLGQIIIFVRTRNSAGILHKALTDYGYEVTTIQGALNQEDRDKIVREFKDGLTKVLISTDLLARGFDQSQVNLVVNYDLPVKHGSWSEPDYEVYLHRVGRAGRFGRQGAVFNLLCGDKDKMMMQKIENHFGTKVVEVASWQSDQDFESALKEAKLL
ncbi:DEAD-box ATP-dependent RNA helicase 38 [Ancistrocladus abbreviatus]